MSEVWDAVVIGAGPAGAITARELARRRLRVLLVDRAAFPRDKVCGCCLNGAALGALASVGLGDLPRKLGGVPLHSVNLAAGRSSATLATPGGVAVSRSALDATLVHEARTAGVQFLDGVAAKIAEPGDGFSVVQVSNLHPTRGSRLGVQVGNLHHEKTRIVILATGLAGHESQVAPGSRLGAGVIVPEAPAFFARGVIYMATGSGGYVGLVRLEDGRLDVAAAFDAAFVRSAGGLGPAADAILRTTAWPRIDGLAELPWKGTPALTRSRSAVAEHRLFAVGDAAGYIEPFTGQGISWAIAGAAALAPIAERTARGWSDSCIKEWRREHRRVVSSRQLTCRLAARVLRSPRLTRIAVAALAWLPALARPVVASLNRPSHGSRS